jgi:RNA polymerase sigma-70 factor (ECF subfamily)
MPSEPTRVDEPERLLLERAAAGDFEAFGAIFRRYQQVVYRFGRAMTGCPTAAEDITQEVFVAVFADLARFDPGRAAFSTYLYGVARNLSRERLRRERRFLPLTLTGRDAREAVCRHDPVEALEGAERAALVRRAMGRLPARYRELIVLCDLHGLSYADAGVVVRSSTAAVRSRLHRARQQLRRQLARLAPAESRRAGDPARCAI